MKANSNLSEFNKFWGSFIFLILTIFILCWLLYFTDNIDAKWIYGRYLLNIIIISILLNIIFIIVLSVNYLIQIKSLLKEKYLVVCGICIKYFKLFRKKKDEIEPVVKNEEIMS